MTVPRHPQNEPPELTEHDGYPIYPMPALASVSASDARRSLLTATYENAAEGLSRYIHDAIVASAEQSR